jgi:hypothetical protein
MTAPSPTDKVVELGARTAAARGEVSALLINIRSRAIKRLTTLAGEVMEKADDTLFDFVQRADGSVSNQDYFEAMRELRKQNPVIMQRYGEHLAAAFTALERRNPLEVNLERSLSESRELSLVSEDQLEEQLGTAMVASALTRHLGSILGQLNYRMGIVAGVDDLGENTNPLGPSHVAYAFRYAMQVCEISTRIKVLLFKMYEREMANGLAALYNEVNRVLVEAGIAPEIKPTYARTPQMARGPVAVRDPAMAPPEGDAPGGYDAAPGAPQGYAPQGGMAAGYAPQGYAGGQGGGYVPMPETAAERSIFASLHQLLSGYRSVQERAGGMTPPAPSPMPGQPLPEAMPHMSANEVLSVLNLMQNEMPADLRAAVDDPEASITQHLKTALLSGAAQLGVNPQSRIATVDEDSIDLVGMLFDVLLDERDFNTSSRQLISRLIVPFVKVAMLDRRMFLQKTHPARRLLNSLAEAVEGNSGAAPQERELMVRAEHTIDQLVAEFNEDIAIFETLEQDFREFIEQHRKRAALAEKRATEAQRGKERLDQARIDSLVALRELLDRHPDLPPGLEAFLRRYWAHHLTLCALRDDGDGSGKRADALSTGDALVNLLRVDNPADREARLGALRPRLDPILQSAGCGVDAAQEVITSLKQALGCKDNESKPLAEAVSALERNAPQAQVVPEPAAVSESDEDEQQPSLQFDEADAEKIRKLQVGAWIQFTEADGAVVPIKLSWVSPISNRMLFVNRRGLRYCVASPEELAAMMGEGKVSLRTNDTAFEHAMTQVLGKLRSSGKSATS